MRYWVEVELTMADEVEADSPEEAFEILSTDAISGGDWLWSERTHVRLLQFRTYNVRKTLDRAPST